MKTMMMMIFFCPKKLGGENLEQRFARPLAHRGHEKHQLQLVRHPEEHSHSLPQLLAGVCWRTKCEREMSDIISMDDADADADADADVDADADAATAADDVVVVVVVDDDDDDDDNIATELCFSRPSLRKHFSMVQYFEAVSWRLNGMCQCRRSLTSRRNLSQTQSGGSK